MQHGVDFRLFTLLFFYIGFYVSGVFLINFFQWPPTISQLILHNSFNHSSILTYFPIVKQNPDVNILPTALFLLE